MPKIVVLDNNMINMIAAGEVIERPASVVKELLENSIDAGATKIILRIEDGGRKLISVTDNGCGIDAEDMPVAFLPHATSKVRTSADLDGIVTMGFRGEALASIASVSQVSVVSRTAGSIQANRIDIDCGDRGDIIPCSGDVGTMIEVRNLFYKLPARRKFLRTANTEMTHINEYFTRIALANCQLDMTLIHNDRQLHRLVSSQSVRERIGQLVTKEISEDLIEAGGEEKGLRITALMGKPARARGNNKYQYVFLNGRYIRDKFIMHAMKEAYRGMIEPNKYPVVFLFLEMDPSDFDVNVHPTKIEVRFQNSNLIHSQVLAVLREKLLSINLDVDAQLGRQSVDLTDETSIGSENQARQKRIAEAMESFFKEHKPAAGPQHKFSFSPGSNRSGYSPPKSTPQSFGHIEARHVESDIEQTAEESAHNAVGFLQLHNSYIVTQTEEGFVIIDQHALHERIIYEDLCRKVNQGKLQSQRLLIPETFSVGDAELSAIKENEDLIEKLGIELESFGPDTMAIQSFPTLLGKVSPADFVQEMIDKLADKSLGLDAERLLHEVLDMAACKAAIKAGQPLTAQEMQQLFADKDAVKRASRCPHGRPTTIKFTLDELEKQFKRTGF